MSDDLDIENMSDDELRTEVADMGENMVRKVCQQLAVYYLRKIDEATLGQIDQTLFEDESEVHLYEVVKQVAEDIRRLEAAREHKKAFLALKDLTEPLAVFFESVMVMADDEAECACSPRYGIRILC